MLSPYFVLKPLTPEYTVSDFEAVMETAERLRASSPNGWPRPGFTLEENRDDLIRHETEFANRESFAYTVLSTNQSRVLGCLYLNPPQTSDAEVYVHMWVREACWNDGLAQHLHREVDVWLHDVWNFSAINYLRPEYYFAEGRCLCGAVAYHAGPLRSPFELCHCNRCRRASGSTYAAGIIAGEVRFISGRKLVKTISLPVIEDPPGYSRSFCSRCGSPVPDPERSGLQEIAAGSLWPQPIKPDRHIHVEQAR